MCSGGWVDTRGSNTNCGACGNACLGDDRCILSRCRPNSKVVFLSSTTQRGNLGGVSGADKLCTSLAEAAGLTGAFVAWVSTTQSSASSRITHATVPYRLPDGPIVANDWSALTVGPLLHAIDQTEVGVTATDDCPGCGITVATNTTAAGEATQPPGYDCFGWNLDKGQLSTGSVRTLTNGGWTYYGWGLSCEIHRRIYCFEK